MIEVLKHAETFDAQFLHVTGKNEYESVTKNLGKVPANVKVVPYLYNMPQAMAMADLAIFRAGATGLAELTARGVPAILIPYPYAAENHQEFNASELVKVGAAKMILNKDLNAEILSAQILELLKNPDELKKMSVQSLTLGKPQAADEISNLILSLANS